MEKNFYIELIYKSFSESLSTEEQRQLDGWLSADEENQKEATTIEKMWSLSSNFSKNIEVDLDKDFAQMQQKMKTEGIKKDAIVREIPTTKRSWWKPLSVAAAVLLIAGAFFIFNKNQKNDINLMASTSDEVKELILADGSKVWLNKNSKLDYPEKMDGDERRVVLSGEAFFDITKNPNKPFIIETAETQVKVLGTSFEVSAYPESSTIEVVVKAGKVAFGKKNEVGKLELTANEKGVFEKAKNKFSERNINDPNAVSWQNKVLDFDNVTLAKVINDLENHFDIQLTLTNTSLSNCPFSNIFNNPKQQETLEAVCEVLKMKLITVDEKTFKFEGGKCPNSTE